MKKMKNLSYNEIVDIHKIKMVYHTIKVSTRHKEKIVRFELFLTSNFITIYTILKERKYVHGQYNIFFIISPKCRVIMSETMSDKIVNHLVSKYVLFPVIEPRLIETNVATRPNKGTKAAIFYLKKYINSLKVNHDKIYALKCDIYKFFYSIDHEILKDKLSRVIADEDILNLLNTIIDSTDYDYVNQKIKMRIENYKNHIANLNISEKQKELKCRELEGIPLYKKGKGLPIGNMTSQIMAIFYLNELDHFIKEKLHIRCYVRYMDDLILLHHDKKYLEYCLGEIRRKIDLLKLSLNQKTQIYEVHQGIPFLGYKFILKGKKLHILISAKTKKRIMKHLRNVRKKKKDYGKAMDSYKGYLIHADSGGFIFRLKAK